MSKLANILLNLAVSVASNSGSKLRINLPENAGDPIDFSFEKVEKSAENCWSNYYGKAGIFIKNYPQEIEIDSDSLKEGKVKLTRKADIEPVINSNMAKAMWGFATDNNKSEQMQWIIIGGIALLFVMMLM